MESGRCQHAKETNMNPILDSLKIKIFADGADLETMAELHGNPLIKGFTTNPSLMRKDGVTDYETFARNVLRECPDLPVSFEVLSDDLGEMQRQAHRIALWGENAYVKVPITNTEGISTCELIKCLNVCGIKVNVTGLTTLWQTFDAVDALSVGRAPAILSVFAGRIADTGRDPIPGMQSIANLLHVPRRSHMQLLWASTRELLNIFQADAVGCDIITVTPDILRKLPLAGKDLEQYSLETVRMFREDALKGGYTL